MVNFKSSMGMLGKKHTEETKNKMSIAKKGRKFSKEHRENISKALKGKKLPESVCIKMSKSKKGIRPKNYEEMRKNGGFENMNHKKENHHNWKGGITPENHLLRNSSMYKIWREAVFLRDNFTCQDCGEFGGFLNAHHIKSFAEYPDLRFIITNGATLCKGCHIELHRGYRIKVEKDKF